MESQARSSRTKMGLKSNRRDAKKFAPFFARCDVLQAGRDAGVVQIEGVGQRGHRLHAYQGFARGSIYDRHRKLRSELDFDSLAASFDHERLSGKRGKDVVERAIGERTRIRQIERPILAGRD